MERKFWPAPANPEQGATLAKGFPEPVGTGSSASARLRLTWEIRRQCPEVQARRPRSLSRRRAGVTGQVTKFRLHGKRLAFFALGQQTLLKEFKGGSGFTRALQEAIISGRAAEQLLGGWQVF